MANICYRSIKCKDCPQYKWDDDRERFACFGSKFDDFVDKELDGHEIGKVDEKGLANLNRACKAYAMLSDYAVYAQVRAVWADFGAQLWWKQIVIYRDVNDSFQIDGNTRERIIKADDITEIIFAVNDSIKSYPSLFKRRK